MRGRRRMTRAGTLWIGWGFALGACAAFVAAGSWQLDRQQQKQAMLAESRAILDARTARPLALAADPARARGYDWAAGRGTFADTPAVLLDNQQRLGRPGVRAYRLFLPDAGTPLLVELGWLPVPGDRTLPAVALPVGTQAVSGLLAPPPATGLGRATTVAQPDGSLLTVGLDAANLAVALGQSTLPPRVLKLDPALSLGYPRDLDILPNTLPPERHLGYAVQWFALAAAVLALALFMTFRGPRR